MKVTNVCKKLAAALVAGGLLAPSALSAANLNTNLVQNAGFEDVDLGTIIGGYNAVALNVWTNAGAVYSHDGTINGDGVAIPDYANNGPLAGGGSFYFTSNADNNESLAEAITQNIDLSTGETAALIATGKAVFNLSAFFNTYANDADWGTVRVDFLDSGGGSLGAREIDPGGNVQEWVELRAADSIPVAADAVTVSVYSGNPNDGYVDNVDFRVTDELILPVLDLVVDRGDGGLLLVNRTGGDVNISGYQITSAYESLAPDHWVSIAENYDSDSGGEVDGANIWTELTQAGSLGDLSEGDLDSGTGTTLGHNDSVILGDAEAWTQTPIEDLVLEYISEGQVVEGLVRFSGNGDMPFEVGDLNTDGEIDVVDWNILRTNQHADLAGLSPPQAYRQGDLTGDGANNHPDFVEFKTAFNNANGPGSFEAMLASVPEPSSVVLVGIGLAGLLTSPRGKGGPRGRRGDR